MSGPRDLNPSELAEYGLGVVERRVRSVGPVTRVYCLRCGHQIAWERRDSEPERWWTCARGCNTQYAHSDAEAARRPLA